MLNPIGRPAANALAAAVAAAALATPALGWIDPDPEPFHAFRLFTPEAKVSADGRKLVVTGMADCGPHEGVVQVAVSVLSRRLLPLLAAYPRSSPAPTPKTLLSPSWW